MSTITSLANHPEASSLVNPLPNRGMNRDIEKVSTEFEAILLSQVLGKLRETFSLHPSSEADAGANTLKGVAEECLCKALAERHGIGLAAMIRGSLPAK